MKYFTKTHRFLTENTKEKEKKNRYFKYITVIWFLVSLKVFFKAIVTIFKGRSFFFLGRVVVTLSRRCTVLVGIKCILLTMKKCMALAKK